MEVESLQFTEEKAIDDGRSIIFDILAIDKDDVICREYVLYDIENKNRLDDSLSIYFVELQKGEESKGENLKDLWIKLLANSKKIDDIPEEDPIIQKAVSKIYQISEIDEVQLKVIEEALEESKRLDWQDDIIEKARQEAQEKIQEKVQEMQEKLQAELQEKLQQEAQERIQQEKINFARSLLDVLDDKTIADKTGLDMDFVKSLRIK